MMRSPCRVRSGSTTSMVAAVSRTRGAGPLVAITLCAVGIDDPIGAYLVGIVSRNRQFKANRRTARQWYGYKCFR
jgi:hypothetical protein